MTPPRPSDKLIAKALVYIRDHGDLWGFDCPDVVVPAIYERMREDGLTRFIKKKRVVTPAGAAFINVVIPR